MLAVGQDVTERKKAEVSLLEMKDKYSVVLENLDDVVFQLSPLGTIEYVSPGAKDWMGYMPEELIGKHLKVTTPATEMPKALNALKRVLSGEKIKSFNMKQRHADGRILDMEINALPIRIEGKIVAVQGIMRDITDCKNVEQEMQNTLSDLENFKKATIARENVMIELKKEINKLSQELGRSAPHDLSFLE